MSLERLAHFCYRRRWRVLAAWILLLVGVMVANRQFGAEFSNAFDLPGTESARAFELLEERFPQQAGDTAFIVFKAEPSIFEPSVQERMEGLFERARGNPSVLSVSSPYDGGFLTSGADGRIGIAPVQLKGGGPELDREDIRALIGDVRAAAGSGIQIELGGRSLPFAEEQGPGDREIIGLVAAVFILLVSFGSVIAMGLPILVAIFGLGVGVTLLGLMNRFIDSPDFTGQLATMIGLGVGIDYALFIVTRYRQTLHAGSDPESSVVTALTTAGRAVIFAGLTVVISVMGMFLMGLSFVRGLALGAATVVLLTVFASITLLPAILGFVGHTIDRLHVPFLHRDESAHRSTIWYRWSRVVQRFPWPAAALSLVVLLVMSAPVLSIRLGFSDASTGPEDSSARRAFDLLAEGFGPGFNGPLMLVAELESNSARGRLDDLSQHLQGSEGVTFITPARVNPAGDTAVVTLFPATGPQDEATEDLIRRLRTQDIPRFTQGGGLVVSVGSPTALFVDMSDVLGSRLPLFMAGVIGLSFLLLLVVFRSVMVPLKAALMNVLGIGAAFGVVVAIFQYGWGDGLLGSGSGPIEPFIPMMLFAIVFGLSMDYEVFLLSRVREEYLRTGNNAEAVADGLAATARVITAAAAIMVTLFLSFVTLGDDRIIKIFGLGLALAIFIDATLIRLVLVPSTMELLGNANWWLPSWLDRLLPKVSVEAPAHVGPPVEVEDEDLEVLFEDEDDDRAPTLVGVAVGSAAVELSSGGNGGDDIINAGDSSRKGRFGFRRRGKTDDDIETMVSSAFDGDAGDRDEDEDEDLIELDLQDDDVIELDVDDDEDDDEDDEDEDDLEDDEDYDEDDYDDEEELVAEDDDDELVIEDDELVIEAVDEDDDDEELLIEDEDEDEDEPVVAAADRRDTAELEVPGLVFDDDEGVSKDEVEGLVFESADDELEVDEDDVEVEITPATTGRSTDSFEVTFDDEEAQDPAPAAGGLLADDSPAGGADEEIKAVAEPAAASAGAAVGGLLDWDETVPAADEDADEPTQLLDTDELEVDDDEELLAEDDEEDFEDDDEAEVTAALDPLGADVDLQPVEDIDDAELLEPAAAPAVAASAPKKSRFSFSRGGRGKGGPIWEHHGLDRASVDG